MSLFGTRTLRLAAAAFAASCFGGCASQYRAPAVWVPLADTVGQGEVSATMALGLPNFVQGTVQAQYAFAPHITAGVQGAAYSQESSDDGDIHLDLNDDIITNLRREAYSAGLNIGTYRHLGRVSFYAQGGADFESIIRGYVQSQGTYPDTTPTVYRVYRRAQYVKPWTQVSLRFRPHRWRTQAQATTAFLMAVRVSRFFRTDEYFRSRSEPVAGLYPPDAERVKAFTLVEPMVGVEWALPRFRFDLQLQSTIAGTYWNSWLRPSPLLLRIGIGYRLGMERGRMDVLRL